MWKTILNVYISSQISINNNIQLICFRYLIIFWQLQILE